jgi:hypothetical protein
MKNKRRSGSLSYATGELPAKLDKAIGGTEVEIVGTGNCN